MNDIFTLLIVDDNRDNLYLLRRVVESLVPGCRVETAGSGEEALSKTLERTPDAALVDVQMSGIDGIELCRRFKADGRTETMPVILITSHDAPPPLRARGLEAGADDFLSRPIDNEELAARIKVALRIKSAEDDLRRLNSRLEAMVAERTAQLAFANRQLVAERNRSRNLIDAAPTIILELDPAGRILSFNPYFEALTGYRLDEVRGEDWIRTFVPEKETEPNSEVFEWTVAGDPTSGMTNPILTKSGDERKILWSNQNLTGEDGRVTSILAIGQDVTEIRRAEEIKDVLIGILRAAAEEDDLRTLISRVRDEIGRVVNTDNFYVALHHPGNQAYEFPFFAGEEDWVGPDERLSLPSSLTEYVRRTGEPLFVDDDVRADLERRGEAVMLGIPARQWLGAPLKTAEGVAGVVSVQSYDDPERYSVDDLAFLSAVAGTIAIAICRRRFQQETDRLGRILEDSVNEVYVFDAESLRFRQVNRGARENLGYTMEELAEMTPFDLQPEFDLERFSEVVAPLRTGAEESLLFTTMQQRKDGSLYPVEVNLSLVSGHGDPIFLAVILDISERRKTEAELEGYRRYLEQMVEERTHEAVKAREITESVNEILLGSLNCGREEEIADACLLQARRLTGAAFGFVGEINDDGTLDTIALDQPAWDACRIEETKADVMIRDMEVRGLWGPVITESKAVIVNDPHGHPTSVGVPEGHPEFESFLGVPLALRDGMGGLLALGNKEGGFGEEDLEAAASLASAFGEALMRFRAEREAAIRTEERQKALNLMVGRELRMAELKDRIRSLQEENRRLRGGRGREGGAT